MLSDSEKDTIARAEKLMGKKLVKASRNVSATERRFVAVFKAAIDRGAILLGVCVTIVMLYAAIKVEQGGGFMMFVFWLCLIVGIVFLRLIGHVLALVVALYFSRKE